MKKEDIKIGTIFKYENDIGYIYKREFYEEHHTIRSYYVILKSARNIYTPGKEAYFEDGSIKQTEGIIIK